MVEKETIARVDIRGILRAHNSHVEAGDIPFAPVRYLHQ